MNAMPHIFSRRVSVLRDLTKYHETVKNYLEGKNVCKDKSDSELPAADA